MPSFIAAIFAAFFDLLRKAALPLARAALILYVLPLSLLDIGWPAVHQLLGQDIDFPVYGAVRLAAAAVGLAAYTGAGAEVARAKAAGTAAKPQELLKAAAATLAPLTAICLLFLLGWVPFGILFILPGYLYAMVFALTVAIHAHEKTGIFRALLRLPERTRAHRWHLLVAALVLGVAVLPVAILSVGDISGVAFRLAADSSTGPVEISITRLCMAALRVMDTVLIALGLTFATAAYSVLQPASQDRK